MILFAPKEKHFEHFFRCMFFLWLNGYVFVSGDLVKKNENGEKKVVDENVIQCEIVVIRLLLIV